MSWCTNSPTVSDSFCEVCKHILDWEPEPYFEKHLFQHHSNIFDLRRSADSGCRLCRRVYDSIPGADLSKWLARAALKNGPSKEEQEIKCELKGCLKILYSMSFTCNALLQIRDPAFCDVDWHLLTLTDDVLASAVEVQNMVINASSDLLSKCCETIPWYSNCTSETTLDCTGSDRSLAQAAKWLSTCCNEHDECFQKPGNSLLPSRLIDLGMGHDAGIVRLRLREEIPQDAVYMTLSHCWGLKPTLKLEGRSLAAFRSQIPIELSKTYTEAVFVARYLGVHYLWIDSLCIIQDSEMDRRQQCSIMNDIYKGSHCNIAASTSLDGSYGCFNHRYSTFFEPVVVMTKWKGVSSLWNAQSEPWKWQKALETPLHQRGWVLQEWLLSRRALHFGEKMIYWECRKKTASEYDPEGVKLKQTPFKIPRALGGPSDGAGILKLWSELVTRYSSSSLTKGEDKLVAISGIAKEFDSLFRSVKQECQYLAGMWSTDLVYQLLWERDKEMSENLQSGPKIPAVYRAPSWSWASVDFRIRFVRDDVENSNGIRHTFITTTGCQVEPLGEDRFLQIVDGRLHVLGWLWTIGHPKRMNSKWNQDIFPDDDQPAETTLCEELHFFLPVAFALPDRHRLWGGDLLKIYGIVLKLTSDGTQSFDRVGSSSFNLHTTLNLKEVAPEFTEEKPWPLDDRFALERLSNRCHRALFVLWDKWSSELVASQTKVAQHFLETTKSLQRASPHDNFQGHRSSYLYDITII